MHRTAMMSCSIDENDVERKTWIRDPENSTEKFVLSDRNESAKFLQIFVKQSARFLVRVDSNQSLEETRRDSCVNGKKSPFIISKDAFQAVIETTWQTLVAEGNAHLYKTAKPFTQSFEQKYKTAFLEEFKDLFDNIKLAQRGEKGTKILEEAEDDRELFTLKRPDKKANVAAPFEGFVHRDKKNYDCTAYPDEFSYAEVEHMKYMGLGDASMESENILYFEKRTNRIQAPLTMPQSNKLLATLKKKGIVHEDYEYQIKGEKRCQMLGNAPGILEEQQAHFDNPGHENTGEDLINVIVALDLMYLTMYREESSRWYKKDVWLTPGSVLCLSGYAAHGGMGALRKPGKNDFHTHTPQRIHLYLKRKRRNEERRPRKVSKKNEPTDVSTGELQTVYIEELESVEDVIDETSAFWRKIGENLKKRS